MSAWLKQSTAFIFRIGPFVDSTDGATAETGLSIAQADIQISKAGAAFAQTSAASPATAHDADGWYQCPLTTTDTATLGTLDVQITMTGALPVWRSFMVMPANVFDSLVSGSAADLLDVSIVQLAGAAIDQASGLINANVKQISEDATAADNLEAAADGTTYNLGGGAVVAASVTALGAQAKLDVNAEVDTALNTAIPGSPTADSVNQRIVAIDTLTEAGGTGSLAAILADTNELQTDWANGGRLDLLLDSAATMGGTGTITFTYTLTNSATALPIATALVEVFTDATMLNLVASGYTNASGVVTFYLNAGTYYLRRSKSGFTFTNPDTEVVA